MWEEHPEYQKAQAKAIGVLVILLFVGVFIDRFAEGGWDQARGVLVFFSCFIAAFALLPLTAWVLINVLKRLRAAYLRLRDPKGSRGPEGVVPK